MSVTPLNFHAESVNRNVAMLAELLEAVRANEIVSLALRYEHIDGHQEGVLIVPLGGRVGHARRMFLIGHLTEMIADLTNYDDPIGEEE